MRKDCTGLTDYLGTQFLPWGRHPRPTNQRAVFLPSISSSLTGLHGQSYMLPYGLGRSYGDSCINSDHIVLPFSDHNHLISFDSNTGLLRAEAGVSLGTILEVFVPQGWFLPVSPGTKFVTLGGAIANDIHGKNHHRAGTFGCHVSQFELIRSSGERLICSKDSNSELFCATIGGLGLTGLITWVELKLIPIRSPYLDTATIKFRNLDEFFDISAELDSSMDYSVSWVDCTAEGDSLGRGLFMAGNFSERTKTKHPPKLSIPFPCEAPSWLLNSLFMRSFNTIYYNKQRQRRVDALTHYEPFFYPLDAVLNWNRMYGKRGFFQYQFVIPFGNDRSVIKDIFARIAKSKRASFLAVLKTFGNISSPGLLSFPKEGVTLALDFPNQGTPTLQLLSELDAVVRDAGGSIYPAKDARMSPEMFKLSHPRLDEFLRWKDPQFSSSLWRRVMESQ
jgi:FAD/FMN-containing dehydrogenase